MDKIRWGIAGPGTIAHKFAEAISNVNDACLMAVASRTEENGKAFAQKYNIPTVFVGYENMASSDEVDAVYISTPHPFHFSIAEMFLKAGKHVLCEKPLCVNAHEAKRLRECAKGNGVFLMEAMWTKFLPAINEALSIVKSGEIGDILSVSADFCYRTTYEEEPKLFKKEMAGGSLLDVGVYGLHFASFVLGNEISDIKSVMQIQNGVDMQTYILLKYKNGAVANITSAINIHKPEDAYIYGTKGFIRIPCFYGASEIFVNVDGTEKHIKKPYIGNGFEEEIMECNRCIKDGKTESDIHPLSDSIDILKIAEDIRLIHGASI